MASLQDVIRTTLEGDATLAATLTGGIYDASETDNNGVSMEDATKETDGIRIKPFAMLRWADENALPPRFVQGERLTMECYLYAEQGYASIRTAKQRVKVLLHEKYFPTATDHGIAYAEYVNGIPETVADELGGRPMAMVRFSFWTARK